ncbi:uncharacterized protein LOC141571082 isoform X2 [Rhinolophus sinicus]|uniref:uncharacterized protein LOC141571082 isoform X2 n=1 Tax=Rhinolophus sinicus TaxID=89399 RepID=UPI003D79FAA0
MPQPGLWMALAPLPAAFNARTAILSPCSGAHCHLLCLVICLLGQHCLTGSCLQCPAGFYRLDGRSALQLCPTGACSALPGLTDSKDSQQYLPRQEPSSQHAGCVFCPLGYFTDGGLGVQPCPTGHFCPDGATTVPLPARSSEGKRETPHPNTSFCWTGTCAQWALLAPTPIPTPARPGPSAGTIASPPCRSVRPAPQDWPALQELGVQTGPPPPAQLAIIALREPNSQPSSSVPRAPGVTRPD